MPDMIYKRITDNKAFTLIEIMLALAILAGTMVPIFFFMSKGASDTDFNVSRMFATTRASEILNAILDNVPFQALRAGIPGFIRVDDLAGVEGYARYNADWAEKFANTVFPGNTITAAGWPCEAMVTDPRGLTYKITLRVEDISSPAASSGIQAQTIKIGDSFPENAPVEFADPAVPELTFRFLRNPTILLLQRWHQIKYVSNTGMTAAGDTNRFEIDIEPNGVSEAPHNFYDDSAADAFGVHADAPRFVNPTAVMLNQRLANARISYTDNEDFKFCGLKRVIIEIQWNLERQNYSNPEAPGPGMRRIHLMTLKANIDV